MQRSLVNRDVTVRQGAYLPHWTMAGAIYAVCFRLADSLPQMVLNEWERERAALLAGNGLSKDALHPAPAALRERLQVLFSDRIERHLDAGHGACWFARPDVGELTMAALQHFNGQRYRLHVACVMPNHVHAVVEPAGNNELPKIGQSWKGYVAREANRRLGRNGPFWQPEYYDHLIRDEADYVHAVDYAVKNPGKAGLRDWKWVWISDGAKARVAEWHGLSSP